VDVAAKDKEAELLEVSLGTATVDVAAKGRRAELLVNEVSLTFVNINMAVVLDVTQYCLPDAYLPNCTAPGPQIQKFHINWKFVDVCSYSGWEISTKKCGKEPAVRVCIGFNWLHIRNRIKTFRSPHREVKLSI
jgi:hypothetical protein